MYVTVMDKQNKSLNRDIFPSKYADQRGWEYAVRKR